MRGIIPTLGEAGQFLDQASLADTGFAANVNYLAVTAIQAGFEQAPELRELGPSSHHRATDDAGLADGYDALEFEHLDRFRETLDRYRRMRADSDEITGQRARLGTDQNAARRGRLLETCRERHGGPGGVVLGLVGVVADFEHDDLARMQADANLDTGAASLVQLVCVLAYPDLKIERRAAGFERVPFACDRRAEHRHDAVAHETADGAAIRLDCTAHDLRRAIQAIVGILGIELFGLRGRSDGVGEQHRHRLAFARRARPAGEIGIGRSDRGRNRCLGETVFRA